MPAHPDDVEARIDELIADMTIEEKAGQLTQFFYFSGIDPSQAEALPDADAEMLAVQPQMVEQALAAGRVGSLLFVRDPGETNRLQRLAIEGNRHGIPVLFGFDVIHGFRTIMPVPIAMAASWDPVVVRDVQSVAATEARAIGLHWTFAPMVDVGRDPRWGRMIEGAGEDPVLGAAMAAAQVTGFQGGAQVAPGRVMSGPKHFAGYGYSMGGRDYAEADISESTMRTVVLVPFTAAIDAGAGNIMSAYMNRNGIPATGDPWLLRTVLRDEWGFDGFVVSDAQAVHNLTTHGYAADLTEAAIAGLGAGCDMEMAIVEPAYGRLPEAVANGDLDEALIDESVRRVLRAKFTLGLFDDPYVDEDQARRVLDDPAHRVTARMAAESTFVLLKNDDSLLPLDVNSLSSIAISGPLAASRRDALGPWVFEHDLDEVITIVDGLRSAVGNSVRVDYAPGVRPAQRLYPSIFDVWPDNIPQDPTDFDDDAELQQAVDQAAAADVAVVVIGEWQNMIGENASRATLDLPGRQLELLQAVAATGTPTVALVMTGRPVELGWAVEEIPAIMQIWYPGSQAGAAVANALLGRVSPAGRLPFTWPRSAGQIPLFYSHSVSHDPTGQSRRYWDQEHTPLFPFGYGLSYSTFTYGPVRLDRDSIGPDDQVTVSVEVTNVGQRPADEVVQLYVHQTHGTSARPIRELKGFHRLSLAPGAGQTVSFTLGRHELQYWNSTARDWVFDRARYEVGVGGDSTVALSASFTVTD